MQAFLWRHLVPAADLKVVVFDPNYTPPPKRVPRPRPAPAAPVVAMATPAPAATTSSPSTTIPTTTVPTSPAPTTTTVAPSGTTANIATATPTSTAPTTATVAPSGATPNAATASAAPPPKPKFTKQQVTQRLRQLKILYEEGLLTDDFYDERVAECDAAQ